MSYPYSCFFVPFPHACTAHISSAKFFQTKNFVENLNLSYSIRYLVRKQTPGRVQNFKKVRCRLEGVEKDQQSHVWIFLSDITLFRLPMQQHRYQYFIVYRFYSNVILCFRILLLNFFFCYTNTHSTIQEHLKWTNRASLRVNSIFCSVNAILCLNQPKSNRGVLCTSFISL